MLLNRFLLFTVGYFVGWFFVKLHLPIPFLLGGMLTAIACKSFARKSAVSWPKKIREYALIVAGYGIGSNFSMQAWQNILSQSLGVFESTVAILSISVLLSYLTVKFTGEDHKSCLMGMLPGGLTVMMLLSEEDKDVNPNIVAVMQVLRMIMVVVTVPFLTIYLLNAKVVDGATAIASREGLSWLIIIPLGILGVFLARKIHLPTPTMLGPILVTALFCIACGPVQQVPKIVMGLAQVCIGLYMGMQMDIDRIMKTKKMIPYIVIATAIMIGVSIYMGELLSARYGFGLITAFLAMAPGGIAEMSLAGLSMGENVSIILTYQLVRVLVLNLLVPPAIKYFFPAKGTLN